MVGGGDEYDGREIAPLDEAAIVDAIDEARTAGIRQIAVSCIFSQLNPAHEERIAALVAQHAPEIEVSLSSDLGRVALLERENAALMNASRRPQLGRTSGRESRWQER